MSLKRDIFDFLLRLLAGRTIKENSKVELPGSILVLRNNDIGDLLVVTPLFEALKIKFPQSKVLAAIGSWNQELLVNNPYVDEIIPLNAPWYNKQVCRYPANSLRGVLHGLCYLFSNKEVKILREKRCEIGIDVLGSYYGSLLMMRAKIPYRLGVKGYAGGHSACQLSVRYDHEKHVGEAALNLAELLGAKNLPENRPQLFLSSLEIEKGESLWRNSEKGTRVVLAPGGGFQEKCWPLQNYLKLCQKITRESDRMIGVIGNSKDVDAGSTLVKNNPQVISFCDKLSLRETFSLIATADIMISSPSMAMHVAAVFRIPAIIILGKYFNSTSRHFKQWGYPEQVHLGREGNEQDSSDIESVFKVFEMRFSNLGNPVE